MPTPRQMSLTPALVASVLPYSGPPLALPAGMSLATEPDYAARLADILATRPPGPDIWIFTYGSLIWSPCFASAEERIATAPGWHRAFCLGWMTSFRGSPDRPGLMMAMDRGGTCKGVAFHLHADGLDDHLLAILRREQPFKNSAIPARWLRLQTADGPLHAIGFPIDRTGPAYVTGLSDDEIAASLATSAGDGGTMAQYLHNTVSHLEARGIHDRYLWKMQDLVAQKIAAAPA